MAAPSLPSCTDLVTEGLNKAGYANPGSALITRASNFWMEEVKSDLFTLDKKLKPLQTIATIVLTPGQNRYSLPSDYSSDLTMTLMNGLHVGQCTAGSSSTVTFPSSETSDDKWMIGRYILMTAGTSLGSFSQITAYNTTTRQATVTPNFTTAPVSGDSYMLIQDFFPLQQTPAWRVDDVNYVTLPDRPRNYALINDSDDGEFMLYPTPDTYYTYGIQLRYYANLTKLDLVGTVMTSLYQRWRNVFVQGVFVKALQSKDDTRYQTELGNYNALLSAVVMRETDGVDLHSLQMRVRDY